MIWHVDWAKVLTTVRLSIAIVLLMGSSCSSNFFNFSTWGSSCSRSSLSWVGHGHFHTLSEEVLLLELLLDIFVELLVLTLLRVNLVSNLRFSLCDGIGPDDGAI